MEAFVRKLEAEYKSKQALMGANNMARLGKILVFVQVGMSLLCATPGRYALWSNHVDWTAQKGKGAKADGELVGRITEYDTLAKASVRPATARWRDSSLQLEREEWWRPAERIWYARRLPQSCAATRRRRYPSTGTRERRWSGHGRELWPGQQ